MKHLIYIDRLSQLLKLSGVSFENFNGKKSVLWFTYNLSCQHHLQHLHNLHYLHYLHLHHLYLHDLRHLHHFHTVSQYPNLHFS